MFLYLETANHRLSPLVLALGYGKTEKRNPFAQVRKTEFHPSLQSKRVQLVFCMGCFEVIFGVPRQIAGQDAATT
jgi:hypothetical protein